SNRASRAEELAALPLFERLERRIVDGERPGLHEDLDAALDQRPALEIINDTLLSGMKTVGELFGSGQMQLPFVLQSAEVMKSTVVMKENLEEMNSRGVAEQWPVLLGGAALTRAYVENDLAELYAGQVRYARDAFEGLRLMDATMAVKRGAAPAADPEAEA